MAMPSAATPAFPAGLLATTLPAGARLFRIHEAGLAAVFFGPATPGMPRHRFDAVAGEFRIVYAARSLRGAFVETVLHRPAGRIIGRPYVEARGWTVIAPRRSLRLARLYGHGLRWHGTDARISASDDYGESRRIALALFRAFPELDGIAYRPCGDNDTLCVALFDRVRAADLLCGRLNLFRNHRRRTDALMRHYAAVFDPGPAVPPP
jgi:hypothetical protein